MTTDRASISAAVREYVRSGTPPNAFMRTTYVVVPSPDFDDRVAAGNSNSYASEREASDAADALNVARPLGEDNRWVVDEVAWIKLPNADWAEMVPERAWRADSRRGGIP